MRENKDFKKGDKMGQGVRALEGEGGLEPPYKLFMHTNCSKILLKAFMKRKIKPYQTV